MSDPRREPMLERVMPADAVPGSTIPERTQAQVQLRDGSWVWCSAHNRAIGRAAEMHVHYHWHEVSAEEIAAVLRAQDQRRRDAKARQKPRVAGAACVA